MSTNPNISVKPEYTEQELREKSAAFDERFGDNAYEFLNGSSEQTQDYKFMATATDGRQVQRTLTAPGLEEATLQSWDVIQQQQRNGVQIESAQIEWSDRDGPQVSYIYDRTQGFEISKPEGLDLQNTAGASQMRSMEDAIKQQTPAQLATQEHSHEQRHHSPVNRQHEPQQQQETSIGFGY